jgi:hypothetical protein
MSSTWHFILSHCAIKLTFMASLLPPPQSHIPTWLGPLCCHCCLDHRPSNVIHHFCLTTPGRGLTASCSTLSIIPPLKEIYNSWDSEKLYDCSASRSCVICIARIELEAAQAMMDFLVLVRTSNTIPAMQLLKFGPVGVTQVSWC